MRFKLGKEKVKPFTKKVPVAERSSWLGNLIDRYFIWTVVVTCIVAIVWMWVKIYQLWKIHDWLMSF